MDRVRQNTANQISKQFLSGSDPVDPGAVTVTVTRDDGTVVRTGTAGGSGTDARTFTLSATDTALLDRLTVRWTSLSLGTVDSTVEVAGGFVFATVEAKALAPTATDAQIQAVRIRVEQALERELGFALVPRYATSRVSDTRAGWRCGVAMLQRYVRAIRWITTDGATVSAGDLANVLFNDTGVTNLGNLYANSVVIGYEHGMDDPPEPLKAAALELARFYLTQDSSVDSRAERLITDDGTLVFGTTGTGLPAVDRVLMSYKIPAIA